MVRNWVCSLERLGLTKYVVAVALDAEAHALLKARDTCRNTCRTKVSIALLRAPSSAEKRSRHTLRAPGLQSQLRRRGNRENGTADSCHAMKIGACTGDSRMAHQAITDFDDKWREITRLRLLVRGLCRSDSHKAALLRGGFSCKVRRGIQALFLSGCRRSPSPRLRCAHVRRGHVVASRSPTDPSAGSVDPTCDEPAVGTPLKFVRMVPLKSVGIIPATKPSRAARPALSRRCRRSAEVDWVNALQLRGENDALFMFDGPNPSYHFRANTG